MWCVLTELLNQLLLMTQDVLEFEKNKKKLPLVLCFYRVFAAILLQTPCKILRIATLGYLFRERKSKKLVKPISHFLSWFCVLKSLGCIICLLTVLKRLRIVHITSTAVIKCLKFRILYRYQENLKSHYITIVFGSFERKEKWLLWASM